MYVLHRFFSTHFPACSKIHLLDSLEVTYMHAQARQLHTHTNKHAHAAPLFLDCLLTLINNNNNNTIQQIITGLSSVISVLLRHEVVISTFTEQSLLYVSWSSLLWSGIIPILIHLYYYWLFMSSSHVYRKLKPLHCKGFFVEHGWYLQMS